MDKRTYAKQHTLSKLPIPKLQTTIEKYLHTIEPLLNKTELASTKKCCDEFLAKEGQELHAQLVDYAKEKESYIEEFWDDAYLAYDTPIPINVNPVFVLEDDPTPSRNQQIPRATSLILSSLKFVRALRKEILEPDSFKGKALCMSQFRTLFGSARYRDEEVPGKDIVVTAENPTHICVIARAQIYYFETMLEDGTICITEREIAKNLKAIREDSLKMSDQDVAAQSICTLTTEDRGAWGNLRVKLLKHSADNEKAIGIIDTALFVVCLDEYSPTSVADMAANVLHGTYSVSANNIQRGTCISRWYDKLQLIVTLNGMAGVNFEHSAVDGHTVLRFASDMFTDTILRFAQTISGGITSVLDAGSSTNLSSKIAGMDMNEKLQKARPDLKPRKLEFALPKEIARGIRFAEAKLSDMIMRNETDVLEYTGYGKQFIVQNGLSPDAYVQLAMLSAYKSLYGHLVNTYESVLTKSYSHGRTEAGRSVTKEALAFVDLYIDEDASADDKVKAMREAVKAHTKMTSECSLGLGVDRHLYALKCLHAKKKPGVPLPKIFTDKGWQTLSESILSTSNCGNPSLRLFGFGPVCEHGYGIGYIIRDDSIHFCITSKKRQTARYKGMISKYLDDAQDLLISLMPKETLHRSSFLARASFRQPSSFDKSGYDFFGLDMTSDPPPPVGKMV